MGKAIGNDPASEPLAAIVAPLTFQTLFPDFWGEQTIQTCILQLKNWSSK
jgi:hypothetical protein